MMDEYKVAKLSNVIEVSNLEPPEWYDVKKGGHNYRWVNLTNLKLYHMYKIYLHLLK